MNQSYRSDLTDEQWEVIKTLIPPAKNWRSSPNSGYERSCEWNFLHEERSLVTPALFKTGRKKPKA